MRRTITVLSGSLLLAVAHFAHAEEVVIPSGTPIYGELQERITSNPRRFKIGRFVQGNVWKDVVVDGHTVVAAGAPMELRIAHVGRSGVGGRGGQIEIMAISVTATDGSEITLTGGYDQAGNDRYGLSRALGMVLWPAGFLPGRRAVLDVGTIFDAAIPTETTVNTPDGAVRTFAAEEPADLTVDVVYSEINDRQGALPLEISLCNREFVRRAEITSVNDKSVRPVLVAIISGRRGNPCHEFRARVNLEDLRDHFSPGINRFVVTMSEAQAEVIFNVEM